MLIEKIITALLPVPLFYMIFSRYFIFRPKYSKHVEAFLYGVAFALLIILLSPYVNTLLSFKGSFSIGFIKAALIEKLGAFFLILIVHRYYPHFSIMESVLSAMMLGLGFSMIENLFYAMSYGYSIILVRLIVSVPLHLTTCGFIGYYLGLRRMSKTGAYKRSYMFKAFFIPFLFHGAFDAMLLSGGSSTFYICPMLIILVLILEIMMARAYTMLPENLLREMDIRFEDWLSINKHPRYERWILLSMGRPNTKHETFFKLQINTLRWILIFLFFALALVLLSNRREVVSFLDLALRQGEETVILGFYPASISVILLLVGAVNPQFFEDSLIQIPIISDVEVRFKDNTEETFVTYSVTSANCFLKTYEPLGAGNEFKMIFGCAGIHSPQMTGIVVWENFTNKRAPFGTIIKYTGDIPKGFNKFLFRYNLFKIRKGIYFDLKLPGFEMIRRLFMRPITTMQKEKLYKEGTKIFNQGDRGNEFYLIKKGKVMFYKKKDPDAEEVIVMGTMETGEIFGEMALVSDNPRAATAVCVTDCVLAISDGDNLHALIKNNPDFAISLIEKLAERVYNSERIFSENIMGLENQIKDLGLIYKAAVLFILTGLGFLPDSKNSLPVDLDFQKISGLVENIDRETSAEVLKELFADKKENLSEHGIVNKDFIEKFRSLLVSINLDIKF